MTKNTLHIRRVRDTDLSYILDWENNVEGWNTHDNDTPYSAIDILLFISEQADIYKAGQVRWMICIDEQPIGAADLTEIDFDNGIASVGILIAKNEHRRLGFATIALELLEEKAIELNIQELISSIHPENYASIDLFEKLGYKEIGKSIDEYLLNGVYLQANIYKKWLKK